MILQLAKEREEEQQRIVEEEQAKRRKVEAQKTLKVFRSGIGKYINPEITKRSVSVIYCNKIAVVT